MESLKLLDFGRYLCFDFFDGFDDLRDLRNGPQGLRGPQGPKGPSQARCPVVRILHIFGSSGSDLLGRESQEIMLLYKVQSHM